ncbi:MAG: hypothetical protein ACMG5Z_07715 [Luteimonas sp.]
MDPISLEDLALLEVLQSIDQGVELNAGQSEVRQRMVDSGLAVDDEEGIKLTSAGIELCKSLQHRVAADTQAAKVLQQREDEAAQAP